MIRTKVYFGLMILFFLSVILVSAFYIQNGYNFNAIFAPQDNMYYGSSLNVKSCIVNLKPAEKVIIIRLDDIRAYSIPTPYIVNLTLSKKIPLVLGVIPNNIEKDLRIKDYLTSIRDSSLIEFAQHGLDHTIADTDMSENEVLIGRYEIYKTFGVIPVTYVPPFNNISKTTIDALKGNYKVLSRGEGERVYEGFVAIGQDTETNDYNIEQPVPTMQVVQECKDALKKTNICVVTLHPQEYSTQVKDAKDVSPEKLKELNNLLDQLKNLNASIKRFKDITYCR